MMSVALDDALAMRARGDLVCARQQVSIAAELLERFSGALVSACHILLEKGRCVSELPSVEPLKVEFFRGTIGQSAASWSGIAHLFLFGDRTRFFQKLRILSDTLDRLDREFKEVAADITSGLSDRSESYWKTLECVHYDVNTCLRESEILLKSFLRALPTEETTGLAAEFESPQPRKRLRLKPSLSRASA